MEGSLHTAKVHGDSRKKKTGGVAQSRMSEAQVFSGIAAARTANGWSAWLDIRAFLA